MPFTTNVTSIQGSSPNYDHIIALFATLETLYDKSWYPNSRPTSHLTLNIGNLMFKFDYTGSNQVHVGNGTNLSIQHIESFFSFQFQVIFS